MYNVSFICTKYHDLECKLVELDLKSPLKPVVRKNQKLTSNITYL